MDTHDIRKGFFDATRQVDKPVRVRDILPEETMKDIARAHRRKYFTYVIVSGPRYIGRRKR